MTQSANPLLIPPRPLRRGWRRPVVAHAFAVAVTTLTLVVRINYVPQVIDRPLLVVFFLPVLFSAYLGGLGPGLVATGIAAFGAEYYLLPPTHSFLINRPLDFLQWFCFVVGCVVACILSEDLHRARRRALTSQQAYAVTLASIADAVITTDVQGRITFANPEAARLTGWSAPEAAGQPLATVFRIVNETTRAAVEDPVRKVLRSQAVVEPANHTVLIARDGREYIIDENAAPLREADGKIIGVVLVFRDSTEKKRAGEILRRNMMLLQPAGHIAKVGGWEYDPATGLGQWDDEVARIHDLDLNTQPTREMGLSFFSGESRNKLEAALKLATETGTPYDLELELITAKGVHKWVRTICQPVLENGKVVRMCGAFQDITDKKAAEDLITREQARFKLIFDTVPIGIAFHTVHPDGRYARTINEAHLRLCGLTREQHDEPGTYAKITYPDDRKIQQQFNDQIHAGLIKQYSYEKRYLHADNKVVWVNFSYQREVYPDGTTEELTTVTDITERKRLEEQLRQSQKMEAIGKLAGGVAHDFNNILAVIQLQIGLLEVTGSLQPEQQEIASEIAKATQRATNLTRQLLLFSRKQALQPRDLDLNDVVTNITKMLQRTLGETIHLEFHYFAGALFIHADPGMMDQILVNLAVNSRDAMPQGGRLTIETTAVQFDAKTARQMPQARPGAFACLSVSDTGTGIPPQVLPRIFDPFFTTKDVGKGTGLGLATVFGIVQQHQGWITVESETGRGTTFRIYLPQLNKADSLSTGKPLPSDVRGGHETILIVEDEAPLCAVLRTALGGLGYKIIEAHNGAEAMSAWQQHRGAIQLLLTDMVLPDGMNGKEIARQLLQANPKLKILYASGYSTDVAGQDLSLVDGVNFLAKPFEVQKLAKTVRDCLDRN